MDSFDILLEPKIHCFKVISKAQKGDRLSTSCTNIITIDHATHWLHPYIPDIFQALRRASTGDSREQTIKVLNKLVAETSILVEAMISFICNNKDHVDKVFIKYTAKLYSLSESVIQSIKGLKNICEHSSYISDADFITNVEMIMDYLMYLSNKIDEALTNTSNR